LKLEGQKERRMRRSEDPIKGTNTRIKEALEERGKWQEGLLKEIMAKNAPNFRRLSRFIKSKRL
jgi:hypothetical protein